MLDFDSFLSWKNEFLFIYMIQYKYNIQSSSYVPIYWRRLSISILIYTKLSSSKDIHINLLINSFSLITFNLKKKRVRNQNLKGVFAKNKRGYRLNAIKKRFWSPIILLLSVASIRRKLIKTSHTEERT